MSPLRLVVAASLLALVAVPTRGADAESRVLQVQAEVERRLLDAARRRLLDQLDAERRAAQAVDAAAAGTAAAVARGSAPPLAQPQETQPPSLEQAALALKDAERALGAVLASSTAVQVAHETQALRVAAYDAALAAMRDRGPATPLDGTWEIAFVPGGTGILTLTQVGTLVTGDYVMQSGATGSVTGTFAGGTLRLDRVDSAAGRDAVLTGGLTAGRLEGTWLATIFGRGTPESGRFTARRRSEPEAPPAP